MSDSPDAIRKYIAPSPRPVIVSRTNVVTTRPPAVTLSSLRTSSGCARSCCASPACTTRPLVEDDGVARDPADDAEVLLDEQHGRQLRQPLEHVRELGDERRREPLRRLVDEQQAVVVEQRPRDRDHLLLAAGERSRPLARTLPQLREKVVDEVVARLGVALGEPQVLLDGEPGEDVAVLGHVADAAADDAVRRKRRQVVAGELHRSAPADETEDRPQRRRLADAVPSEQRGHAALRNVERHALKHVRLPEVDVQVAHLEQRLRLDGGDGHQSSSPR